VGADTGGSSANNYAPNLLGLDGCSYEKGGGVAFAWQSGDEADPGSQIQAAHYFMKVPLGRRCANRTRAS